MMKQTNDAIKQSAVSGVAAVGPGVRRVGSSGSPSNPRPRGRWAVSRRGELDRQPDGLATVRILSSRLSTLPSLSSDGGGNRCGKH